MLITLFSKNGKNVSIIILYKIYLKIIMKIDKQTLKKTNDCQKNFECLVDDCNVLCKLVDSINQKVHFVECILTDDCKYKIPFSSYRNVCTCPSRKEIFNRYGV